MQEETYAYIRNMGHINEYHYLDVVITTDGMDEKDILVKTEKENRIGRRVQSTLWNKDISVKKKTVCKTVFESTVIYVKET